MTVVVGTTLLCVLLRPVFNVANLAMIFLLAVMVVAVWRGRRESVLAAVLSVAAFDVFCVPPYYTFAVSDGGVRGDVRRDARRRAGDGHALLHETRLREQALVARAREHRTLALFELSRDLASTVETEELVRAGLGHLRREFAADAVALLPDPFRQLHAAPGSSERSVPQQELAVARWVLENDRAAGRGTNTLPAGEWLFLPLRAGTGTVGVVGIHAAESDTVQAPDRRHLLEVFASQIAVGLERGGLGERARRATELEEMNRLKSEFVSTASHELRSPLTGLLGALERLQAQLRGSGAETRALLEGAAAQAKRLRAAGGSAAGSVAARGGSCRSRDRAAAGRAARGGRRGAVRLAGSGPRRLTGSRGAGRTCRRWEETDAGLRGYCRI